MQNKWCLYFIYLPCDIFVCTMYNQFFQLQFRHLDGFDNHMWCVTSLHFDVAVKGSSSHALLMSISVGGFGWSTCRCHGPNLQLTFCYFLCVHRPKCSICFGYLACFSIISYIVVLRYIIVLIVLILSGMCMHAHHKESSRIGKQILKRLKVC